MAKTMKDAAWSEVLAGISKDYKDHILGGGHLTREQFLVGWSKGKGAPLIAAYEAASDTEVAKAAVPLIAGEVHKVIDAMHVAGGDAIRSRNPELTQAEAVVRWLETDDGRCLYAIGAAMAPGSRFESHPKQMQNGLNVVREAVVSKSANFDSHPLSLKLSALLKAGTK